MLRLRFAALGSLVAVLACGEGSGSGGYPAAQSGAGGVAGNTLGAAGMTSSSGGAGAGGTAAGAPGAAGTSGGGSASGAAGGGGLAGGGGSAGAAMLLGPHAKLITVDTSPAGADTTTAVAKYPLALKLDSTNFDFDSSTATGA